MRQNLTQVLCLCTPVLSKMRKKHKVRAYLELRRVNSAQGGVSSGEGMKVVGIDLLLCASDFCFISFRAAVGGALSTDSQP